MNMGDNMDKNCSADVHLLLFSELMCSYSTIENLLPFMDHPTQEISIYRCTLPTKSIMLNIVEGFAHHRWII